MRIEVCTPLERICKNCHGTFQHNSNTRGLFCSRSCYHTYRAAKPPEYRSIEYVTLTCGHCGKIFERDKQQVRSDNQYCSMRCSGLASTGRVRAASRPAIPTICGECGVTFMSKASRPRKYCSRACGSKAHARAMLGDGNANHRHGQNQSSARTIALRFYPARCIICGFDVVVLIHHILPKSQGGTNEPANLAVLCPNHHAMADRGLIDADELASLARQHIRDLIRPGGAGTRE